jgi:hypothetical protein
MISKNFLPIVGSESLIVFGSVVSSTKKINGLKAFVI